MSVCQVPDCENRLGPKNRSGYCRKHFSTFAPCPERGAKISASRRKLFQECPEALAAIRAAQLRMARLPQTRAAGRKNANEARLWERGLAAMTPEARLKGGQRSAQTRMAWCPSELRDQYDHLIYSKRLKREEAKAIILAQHEANLRELRRKMGVTGPVEVVEPDQPFVPVGKWAPNERATRHLAHRKAEHDHVEALRVERGVCIRCGTRTDIGCEHTRVAA